jgi:hypothetical protein
MRRALIDHALSLVVGTLWIALLAWSYGSFDGTTTEWLSERAGGHSDDTFGALLIIIATKWLRERGSPQSK